MGTMSHAIALCVIIEGKTKEYINFKQSFQRVSAGQVRIIDIDGVKKMKGSLYVDRLNATMKGSHAIVVVCSKNLKSYLDSGAKSTNDLLKADERKALLKGFQDYQSKVILVNITEDGKENIPGSLVGLGVPINGTNDLDTLSDKVKTKLFA